MPNPWLKLTAFLIRIMNLKLLKGIVGTPLLNFSHFLRLCSTESILLLVVADYKVHILHVLEISELIGKPV